ncbi:KpsF/GutQ family sugar-phosphate isomerase [Shewanella sp. 1_MG-2023]|uniref:Arabinose 5-phosphate isomerase n=1 Tax=Shewanella electrodiphila TaxID=934143 RepID=A0ABT0KPQ6_9GAMM|nr:MULTISPECIES: KpsF/GutQ family sugar-phosphate isomerase [Shewanella]MCL1045728.1 KpsF/GutQ family sugar-phosphate isomerase [Shewanella electrodiphila]MDO6613497.1 KpsF/GutQ family sugar-phosphate isomerase [Shewanella sp. 7_MG-2023]MDO6773327.1 KpsF/GutQ family sugar-phosphate isomerase [Shewanella sp. 2_MG-2023]MDO6795978.1 KpsF/GutQ family sugar-phosphate isomerase [Shewanella sp. 1_MG-2023]PMG76986.1 D-arabinose 5-phosphate isomerase [Shewanella sp. 10N.286.51.B7]
MIDQKQLRQWGRQVIDIEKTALDNLYQYVDSDEFGQACELILQCKGKVIVMGMGKSGHIGNKISATLASTGTPAFFVHPGEASHGDLGALAKNDIVLAISNSGESSEILTLLPVIQRMGVPVIAVTGKPDSNMARLSKLHLCIEVPEEACPLGLAPTSSTTATLVMGDALAVALLQARGFTRDDFALSHPGGSLGRKLLLKVSDVMHQGADVPIVNSSVCITESLYEISNKGLGMTAVTDDGGQLVGIFTDGDLRRVIDAEKNLRTTAIADVMTPNCITISADILAAQALQIMDEKSINGLIVVDNNQQPVGALNMLDMVKAGVI